MSDLVNTNNQPKKKKGTLEKVGEFFTNGYNAAADQAIREADEVNELGAKQRETLENAGQTIKDGVIGLLDKASQGKTGEEVNIEGGDFNSIPTSGQGENLPDLTRKDATMKNTLPGYWDYMKQTSGGKGGAITRIAGGALQGLGNAVQGFAHGATFGKTPAPGEVKGDPFGLQGYGDLQKQQIESGQALAKREAELGQEINTMIDKLPIEQQQTAMALNSQLQLLVTSGKVSAQTQKEIIKATIEGDINRIKKIAADVGLDEVLLASILSNPLGAAKTGADLIGGAINTVKDLPSDVNAKTDIKPAGEYSWPFIKKREPKVLTREEKLAAIRRR